VTTLAEVVAGDVLTAAPALIGWTLLVDGVGGPIVEVEAYREDDPASHSFGGPRGRNVVMFGPPGFAYVYRSYGVHWCLNVVCEAEGRGAAVLVRALEPTYGLATMRTRRGAVAARDDRLLCSGPGRLTHALGVTGAHHGLLLGPPPVQLLPPRRRYDVVTDTRIGITKAVGQPWRFLVADSPYVSRRLRNGRRRA
jgi:DNA-3-methyladenine glycosylase